MLYNNRRTSLLSLIAALLLYITQARPLVRNIQSTHGTFVWVMMAFRILVSVSASYVRCML